MSKNNRRFIDPAKYLAKQQSLEQKIAELETKLVIKEQENKATKHELSVIKSKLEKAQRQIGYYKHTAHKEAQINAKYQRIIVGRQKPKKTEPKIQVERQNHYQELYIPQFIRRLQEHYPGAFTSEQIDEMRQVLLSLDADTVYSIISGLALNKLMYESDSTYTDIETQLEPAEIYEYIMGFAFR